MNTPESAVRHDEYLIAGLRLRDDRPDEPLQIVLDGCAIAQRRERSGGIPAEVRAIAKNLVRMLETHGQAILHQTGSHHLGTQLEDAQNPRASYSVPQASNPPPAR